MGKKSTKALRKRDPALGQGAYAQLWGIVDGGVRDAFKSHPDYLTPKGQQSAVTSIVKRVTGTVIGFAEQSAKGRVAAETEARSATPAEPRADGDTTSKAGAGGFHVSPTFRVRIGRVRSKIRSRYRSPQAFDIKTSQLLRAVAKGAGK